MLFKSTTLALFFAGATTVRAHGYVQEVSVDGKTYPAYHPFEDPYASPPPQTIERKVADDGPVTFDSPDLPCNKNGQQGNGKTATVPAGSDVTWTMNRWPDDHKGPISVYMANCNGDCDSFDGSGDCWFKVAHDGLINAKDFYWASDKLVQNGNTWNTKVPSNIEPGNYLIRLELLALHSAGQPQLYPSCTQVKVTGGGDGAPAKSELVSIPGVYKQGDPALFGDIWSQPKSWPQVGPNIASFIAGGDTPPPAPDSPSGTESSEPSTPASTSHAPKPTKSTKKCKRKVAIVKKSSHAAKRDYLQPFGKRRL